MAKLVELQQHNLEEIINSNPVVLVDFYAPWCSACNTMSRLLDSGAAQIGDAETLIVKVDTEKFVKISERQGISVLPTFQLYRNGKFAGEKTGVTPLPELQKFLQQ